MPFLWAECPVPPLTGVRPAAGGCLEAKLHLFTHQLQSTHTHSEAGGITLSIHYSSPRLIEPGCWELESKIPCFTSDTGSQGK